MELRAKGRRHAGRATREGWPLKVGQLRRAAAGLPRNGHVTGGSSEAADGGEPILAGLKHRNDIQGLRAVAVLLVVLGHAGVSFLKGGYVGVDVFFVLSGFLITGLLLSAKGSSRLSYLTEFYARRARRILPAAALTLLVTDIVAYQMLNFVRAKQVLQDSIAASIFTANIHFANQGTDYFAQAQPPSPVQHFWSLAVEEQFYLVWPAIVSLVVLGIVLHRRRTPRPSRDNVRMITARGVRQLSVIVAAIAVGSLAWSISDTNSHPTAAYFSTFARAWELALGAALAIGSAKVARIPPGVRAAAGWVGIAAVIVSAVTFSASTPFPGYAALLPTVGAALIIAAGIANRQPRFGVGRVLAIGPMRYIGDRSYTLYLWHWPALIIALQYEGHSLSTGIKLLLVAGAFALSIVTYAVFENPIRRISWRSARPALLLWPASVAIVVAVAATTINSIDVKATRLASAGGSQYPGLNAALVPGVVSNSGNSASGGSLGDLAGIAPGGVLPPVAAAGKAAQAGAPIPSGLTPPVGNLLGDHYNPPSGCAANEGQTSSNICTLGSASGAKSIVLFGDSHAQMWIPTLSIMAQKDRWAIHPITKSSCSPPAWIIPARHRAECTAWYSWAVGQIKHLHPDVTMIAADYAGFYGQDAAATAGMQSLATTLKRYSKKVVIMGDQPPQRQQPVDCLLGSQANMGRCSFSPDQQQLAVASDISTGAANARVGYIDTSGWFCSDNVCPMVIGHTVVYTDGNHVTTTYARELAEPFRAAFRAAIRLKTR